MATSSVKLPPGFILDSDTEQQTIQSKLPPGFVLDNPNQSINTVESSYMGDVAKNLLPSTGRVLNDYLVQPVIHPVKTIRGIMDLGSGVLAKSAQGVSDIKNLTKGKQTKPILGGALIEDINKAESAGNYLKNRYGSPTAIKEAFRTDPAGVITDIAMTLEGGGAALKGSRLANIAKIGGKIEKVGELANPVAWGAKGGYKIGSKLIETASKTPKVIDSAFGITKAGKEIKAQKLSKEATNIYRDMLRPTQGEIKNIEIRGNKNIDDYYKLAAEEKLQIKQTPDKKLDTKEAVTQLEDKQAVLHDSLNKLLENNDQTFNLYTISSKSKEELANKFKNAKELEDARADIDDYITAEIKRYGKSTVSATELNNIKQGMWSVGYNQMKPTAKSSARIIGYVAKDAIEKAIPSAPVKALNQQSGKYATLINLLENAQGRVVKGGRLGGYFARATGAIVGHSTGIPIVGPVIGEILGGKIEKAINNPELASRIGSNKMGKAEKYLSAVGKKTPTTEDIINKIPFNPVIKKEQKIILGEKLKEKPIIENPAKTIEKILWKPLSRGEIKLKAGALNEPELFEAYKKAVDPNISLEQFNDMTLLQVDQRLRQVRNKNNNKINNPSLNMSYNIGTSIPLDKIKIASLLDDLPTAKQLVESKTTKNINKKLDKIFGTEREMQKIDDLKSPVTIKYLLSNKYRADIEYAARIKDISETEYLLKHVKKILSKKSKI